MLIENLFLHRRGQLLLDLINEQVLANILFYNGSNDDLPIPDRSKRQFEVLVVQVVSGKVLEENLWVNLPTERLLSSFILLLVLAY